MAKKIIGGEVPPTVGATMEPLGDKVFCEFKGVNYVVLAVGQLVNTVNVGDVVTFPKSAILDTKPPKASRVFVHESNILARVNFEASAKKGS